MTPAEPNPTVARRRLAVRFRTLREARGYSKQDLAAYLGVPEPQASRLDTGARGFNLKLIEQLARWYQLSGVELAELLALGAESRKRGWWQKVDLADSYRTLIGLEQIAAVIDEYNGNVVPGLLQTPDYARAAIRGDSPYAEDSQIRTAISVRLRRQQQLLQEDSAVKLRVVIDEAVLARTTGGDAVMAAQLAHLVEMSRRPRIDIQIVGFETGVHPGSHRSHFILIDLGDDLPDVLYLDAIGKPEDTDKTETVSEYRRAWNDLGRLALDPTASRSRIETYLSRLHSD